MPADASWASSRATTVEPLPGPAAGAAVLSGASCVSAEPPQFDWGSSIRRSCVVVGVPGRCRPGGAAELWASSRSCVVVEVPGRLAAGAADLSRAARSCVVEPPWRAAGAEELWASRSCQELPGRLAAGAAADPQTVAITPNARSKSFCPPEAGCRADLAGREELAAAACRCSLATSAQASFHMYPKSGVPWSASRMS